jgi:hypothetical protein
MISLRLLLLKKKHNIVWNGSKAGFGESDVADNLDEASENIAAISNLCQGKELSCDTKNFVQGNDSLPHITALNLLQLY